MRQWGWSRTRQEYLGRKSLPIWLRSLSAAVPWITMLILFMTVSKIDGTFFLDEGTLIDLPDGAGDISRCHAVAYVSHTDEGGLIFFDDTRYVLNNPSQMDKFSRVLFERLSYVPSSNYAEDNDSELSVPTLLLLIDRRITLDDQMHIVRIAKKSGVGRIMIAERKEGVVQE
ncbi:MAG: hypothetical protein J6W10_09405 [Kiritimatiellae bacterium]|jgi:hypothetical protein|nr:hypothetical protein [Kiritimatiellia bacterium]